MKTNMLRTSLLAVVAAVAVCGQSSNTPMQVTVPFDFIVGHRTLPAGQYSVDQRSVPDVVVVKSADQKRSAIVIGPALQTLAPNQDGKLVFHRYGNKYFLAEVWKAGNYGRQIPKTPQERELAARGQLPDSTILLASR